LQSCAAFLMEDDAMRYSLTMALATGAMLCSAGDQAKADAGASASGSWERSAVSLRHPACPGGLIRRSTRTR
jgi:hypothetical protein